MNKLALHTEDVNCVSNDLRWALKAGVGLGLMTLLPYLLGFVMASGEWSFSGFLFGVEDGNSYIAKMLRGAAGDWLFRTPYTPVPQSGFLAFFPYLLLGKLSAAPGQHEQLLALFQGFRIGAVVLAVLATHQFAAIFIKDTQKRRIATLVISGGGGLGWLYFIGMRELWQGRLPLEFYSPETFGFLSIYGLPHLAAARAFLLWGLAGYLCADSNKARVLSGASWAVLGIMQPATVAVGWFLVGAHLVVWAVMNLWKRERNWQPFINKVRTGIILFGISAPLLVYTAYSFLSDPYLIGWSQQNKILSPPVTDYLLAWGGMLPLVGIAARNGLSRKVREPNILYVWVGCALILAYLPFNLQRRLPEGTWVALVLLSITGLQSLRRRKWANLLIGVSFLPTILLVASSVFGLMNPQEPQFIPQTAVRAVRAVSEEADKDDLFLAGYQTSNFAPAWIPVRTLTGHGPESIGIEEKNNDIERFYCGTDQDRQEVLEKYPVKYVARGPEENNLCANASAGETLSNFAAMSKPRFVRIFKNETYEIYRYEGW